MISLNDTMKIVRNHMRMLLRDVPAGIATDNEATPAYTCDKYGLPPICKVGKKHREVQKICTGFYNTLSPGEHRVTCPFGITISYLKMDNASMPIGFFLQTGYAPQTFRGDTIADLNRVPKKAIKRALEATPLFKFSSTNDSETLNLLSRTLETLLAGRVEASMRALTHQILTPVQGVMSDLEEIKYRHKRDKYKGDEEPLMRLGSNIDEIVSLAKQIHVLLSEDLEPSPQRIRKVIVHNAVKRICDRLESVATRKDLRFVNHFNKGIKIVEAVPDQLVIVLRCLLDNAAKYSFKGKTDHKRTVDIYYEDAYLDDIQALRISIRSFGCPITMDEIEERKIFQLGYRGEYSGDRGRQGTGSGLYIAERIVHAHYGIFEVESKITENTSEYDIEQALNTFSVLWPKTFLEVE